MRRAGGRGVWNFIDYLLRPTEFHSVLGRLVEAGLEDHIMHGFDQMVRPEAIERAVEAIESADFLSVDQ